MNPVLEQIQKMGIIPVVVIDDVKGVSIYPYNDFLRKLIYQ